MDYADYELKSPGPYIEQLKNIGRVVQLVVWLIHVCHLTNIFFAHDCGGLTLSRRKKRNIRDHDHAIKGMALHRRCLALTVNIGLCVTLKRNEPWIEGGRNTIPRLRARLYNTTTELCFFLLPGKGLGFTPRATHVAGGHLPVDYYPP